MTLRRLLLIAACVHLAVAAGACLAGRRAAGAGGTFGEGGIASFASDGRVYRPQIVALERTLKDEGAAEWLRTPAPVHVKLYSLSFALFSPVFGQTILSAEPLNLFYYLATLLLIFALGREAFGEREGLLAAVIFAAAVPSYLLHTTQLLKDPLFVVVTLTLVLVSLKWLTTEYTPAKGLLAGAVGGAAAASLWLIKNSAWWVVLAVMLLGAALCVARQVRRRAVLAGNLAGITLMLAIALGVSHFVTPYWLPKEYWMPYKPGAADNRAAPAAATAETPPAAAGTTPGGGARRSWSSRVVARVTDARALFIELYPDAGSNIDADVRFVGAADVVRYLPRAALVGLCAPFPDTWLRASGSVGRAGRMLSGCETLVMYFVQLLALQSLWHRRRQLPVWLLVLTALLGVVALGLVVVNVGALYRQRYLFWILFVIAGAEAAARMLRARFAGAT